MNKYDFGYELNRQVDPVGQWAFEQIRNGAHVLEVGSSNGRLSKHLHEDLGCLVDIVEINAEAGEQAAQFAQNAWIGAAGDIESEDIYDQLRQQSAYDYIIFLDVLEHLRDPEKVLERMGTLLAPGGKLVISVPNIAHNSVLIELWNNRFSYTPLGLLDDTHIHFFTPASFIEMAHRCGFFVCKISATQKVVSGNEIANSYDDVPDGVAEYLRAREHADIYQLLTVLSLEPGEEPTLDLCSLPETLCHTKAKIYYGNSEAQSVSFFVDLHHAEIVLDTQELASFDQLRLDPMEQAGFVRLISAQGVWDDRTEELELLWSNGMALRKGEYLFDTCDPQFMFRKPDGVKQIRFAFNGDILPADYAEHISGIVALYCQTQDRLLQTESSLDQSRAELAEQKEQLRQREETLEATRGELKRTSQTLGETQQELDKTVQSLEETRGELDKTVQCLEETRGELSETMQTLQGVQDQLKQTQDELQRIYASRSWRFMSFFWRIKAFFKRLVHKA